MAPVLVTILLPMIFGFAFSPEIVAGMLPGLIVSGFQFSCSTSLSGEAWRAARRQVEKGEVVDEDGRVHGVGSMAHRAATIGSCVGVMIKKNASCSVSSALRLIGMLAVLFGSKFA
jgi:K(+)-stimulated pyrophosphate-energized sodium pump